MRRDHEVAQQEERDRDEVSHLGGDHDWQSCGIRVDGPRRDVVHGRAIRGSAYSSHVVVSGEAPEERLHTSSLRGGRARTEAAAPPRAVTLPRTARGTPHRVPPASSARRTDLISDSFSRCSSTSRGTIIRNTRRLYEL